MWAGLRLFVRDVSALDVPEGIKADIAALMTSADSVSDQLSKLESAALQGTDDAMGLAASVESAIADLITKIDALGVSC